MDMHNMIAWTPGITLDDIERQVIEKAFNFFRYNKTATANSLGISIRTLENKLNRYRQLDFEHRRKMHEIEENRREFNARSRGLPFIPQPFADEAPEEMAPQIDDAADMPELPPPGKIGSEPMLTKKVVIGGR